MRQVVLDTETTGIDPKQGNRVIEIGCVELIDRKITRNHYHQYIQPDRKSEEGALAVHGITSEFLADKPRFEDIAEDFLSFIKGAELVIHNAPFDIGFLNHEFNLLNQNYSKDLGLTTDYATVLDTLVLAKRMHPGQKNNLNALCKRYEVNNDKRELHGALLDAEILADVYLLMTGGQSNLLLDSNESSSDTENDSGNSIVERLSGDRTKTPVIIASSEEMTAHDAYLKNLGDNNLWNKTD